MITETNKYKTLTNESMVRWVMWKATHLSWCQQIQHQTRMQVHGLFQFPAYGNPKEYLSNIQLFSLIYCYNSQVQIIYLYYEDQLHQLLRNPLHDEWTLLDKF